MSTIENIKKQPLFLLLAVIIVIILLVGIFRSISPYLTLGFGGYAHIGGVRGAFSFETFENESDSESVFAMVYAPWCGHCKTAKPEFEKLMQSYKGPTKMMMINGDENKEMTQKMGVKGFPTLRYYPNGLSENYEEYNGERTADAMEKFVEGFKGKKVGKKNPN